MMIFMKRLTIPSLVCAAGLLLGLARGEAQTASPPRTPVFVDADGDGINDAYQGVHRARGMARSGSNWLATLSKVKLTTEQQARLGQASQDYQKAVVPIHAAFTAARVKLREAIQAAQPDRKAIDAQIDAVNGLRSQIQKTTAAYQLTIQGILTPEQWAALNEAARNPGGILAGRRGPGKGNEDVFIDEDGDGICDGRGIGRRPLSPGGHERGPANAPQRGHERPE
jgi:Spy/CpxP family protein refolding chaperone